MSSTWEKGCMLDDFVRVMLLDMTTANWWREKSHGILLLLLLQIFFH